jgi:kynurenine formamidase
VALPASFRELAAKVRNWGRWGDKDELGTLNLIDAAAVRRGVACATEGRRFSLAMPLQADGIQMGFIPGRINPRLNMHQVNEPIGSDPEGVCANDDAVSMGLQAGTHWDGLSHVSYGGHLYNGYPASSVTTAGTSRCGIEKVATVVSRGVLLDVARARGVGRLDGGYPITGEDLDAAVDLARVTIEPGDLVLVRTGQMEYLWRDPPDKFAYIVSAAGPSMRSVTWFRDHDVAAVATDNLAFEVYPWEDPEVVMPVHLLHIVEMGLTQGQNWVLDALADDCAADGRYTFLLEASPQPFVGAAGSPVNPVAIK